MEVETLGRDAAAKKTGDGMDHPQKHELNN